MFIIPLRFVRVSNAFGKELNGDGDADVRISALCDCARVDVVVVGY